MRDESLDEKRTLSKKIIIETLEHPNSNIPLRDAIKEYQTNPSRSVLYLSKRKCVVCNQDYFGRHDLCHICINLYDEIAKIFENK